MGAGFNMSPWVPGLSFLTSFRKSTFLSIFAVPNNADFWRTFDLTFTPILFMHSPKLTETAPSTPITTGTTKTVRMRQTFATSSFNNWYFCTFSCSLSFTLSIMTASLSVLSIKTMYGFLASIFPSQWTVKSHNILKFSLSITPSGFWSYEMLVLYMYHKVANGYTVPRHHVFRYILSAPSYYAHSQHGPSFLPYLCDQCEISYNLFSTLVPGHHISGPQYILSNPLCIPLSRHITVNTFLSSHILPMYSFFLPFFLHLLYFIYSILLLTPFLSSTFLNNTSLLFFTYQLKLFSSLLVHFLQLIRPLPHFFLGTYILATLLLGCNSLFYQIPVTYFRLT